MQVVSSYSKPLVTAGCLTKAPSEAKSNETVPSCQSRETLTEQIVRLSDTSAASVPN